MADEKITVQQLLSQRPDIVSKVLANIYEHSPWVSEALIQKPDLSSTITTISQLAAAMNSIVQESTKERKVALLCVYPDLCEKVEKLKELTKESQEEQRKAAGLQSMEGGELKKFTRLHSSYREKFNFPFILAVRNATKYTVLGALEGRLPNPPEKEFTTALEQVQKIAWMRLLSLIDTDDASGFLTCHVLDTANGCPGKFDYISPCESLSLQLSN
jgi:2-oxo-4-hydroxy-4-carboxy-5-ureidoimidazoline decarboxylase